MYYTFSMSKLSGASSFVIPAQTTSSEAIKVWYELLQNPVLIRKVPILYRMKQGLD